MTPLLPLDPPDLLLAVDVDDVAFIIIAIVSLLWSFVQNLRKSGQRRAEDETQAREERAQRAERARRAQEQARRRPSPAPSPYSVEDEEDWDEEEAFAEEVDDGGPAVPAPAARPPRSAAPLAPRAPGGATLPARAPEDPATLRLRTRLAQLDHDLEALDPHWQQVHARAAGVPELAPMAGIVDARLRPRASALAHRSRDLQRRLAAEPAAAVAADAGVLARDVAALRAAADTLATAASQRVSATDSGELTRVERLATGLTEQLPGLARLASDQVAARPLALVGRRDPAAAEGLVSLELQPVWVPNDFRERPEALGVIAAEIGRDVLVAAPALGEQIRAAIGAPARGLLPGGDGPIYLESLSALLASWYPVLFADAFATALLGPAWLTGLAVRHAWPRREAAVAIATGADGETAATEPPLLLRLIAAREALRALGGFEEAADERFAAWLETVPERDRIYLPLRSGGVVAVPAHHFEPIVGEAARKLLDAELPALAHGSLRLLAAPAWDVDLEGRARRGARLLRAGEPLPARPRIALAAALHAAQGEGVDGRAIVRALLGLAPAAAAATARPGAQPAATSLPAALAHPTPDLLVEAMVFRAVFDE
jgi:hypothetical protein